MEKEFWHKAWKDHDIGFHLDQVNPALQKYGPKLLGKKKAFLPMCGKTLDLLWFSENFEEVYGVELSEQAILEFFDENKLEFKVFEIENFKVFESNNIKIYCGDFFKFPIKDLNIDLIFDRGSLVALPFEMRQRYLEKISTELQRGSRWFISSFEYPQEEMEGPPFSVTTQEIKEGLKTAFEFETVAVNDFDGFGLSQVNLCLHLLDN